MTITIRPLPFIVLLLALLAVLYKPAARKPQTVTPRPTTDELLKARQVQTDNRLQETYNLAQQFATDRTQTVDTAATVR